MYDLLNNLWMISFEFVYVGDTYICSDVCLRWIIYLILKNLWLYLLFMSNYFVSVLQPEEEPCSKKIHQRFYVMKLIRYSDIFLLCDCFSLKYVRNIVVWILECMNFSYKQNYGEKHFWANLHMVLSL